AFPTRRASDLWRRTPRCRQKSMRSSSPTKEEAMIKGFKEFITRGNVIDLATGLIIGAAFTAVVNALVDGLINPLIAALFGEPDLSNVGNFKLNGAEFSIGLVLTAIINFLLVAAAIYFLIVTPINKLAERRKKDETI